LSYKTDWLATDSLMAEDLNRIEANTKYIAETLRDYSYPVPLMNHKTNWVNEDIIYAEDLNRIEKNVNTVCKSYFLNKIFEKLKTDWETLDPVDFNFTNRIEKNLKMTNDLVEYMKTIFIRAGVCNAGQNKIYQQRFRR